MENQLSSKGFTVNNGVILGVAMVLFSLVMYATGNHLEPHWSSSVVTGLLFVGIIVFGIKKYIGIKPKKALKNIVWPTSYSSVNLIKISMKEKNKTLTIM